jgi:hypothetical protein
MKLGPGFVTVLDACKRKPALVLAFVVKESVAHICILHNGFR